MSDAGAVALAAAVWLAAAITLPGSPWLGALVVAIGLVARRPVVLVAGTALVAGALATSAWGGLIGGPATRVVARAVLVGDPVAVGHAARVDVRIEGRRVEAWARGDAAEQLADRLAGEIVELHGRLRPVPDAARARLAVRHIATRMSIEAVGDWQRGSVATRAANEVRHVLERGMASLDQDRAALLRGFLVGDDRDVPPTVEADFRASGLTHLLAVSGSNVAFVLAAAGPLLRRLQLRGRLIGSLGVIAFFALVTRAEPSVLRASAMAAIACWAAFAGRPVSRVRVLALAVAGLVLVDPLLVHSIGFRLSVGASLGLSLLAGPLAARLPGPRWLAEPLAVTLAAQVGVAPVLVSTFGGIPLVTVATNLLAVPVAGPLTAWGLVAGLVAGAVGGSAAAVLHAPSSAMVGWISGVARVGADVPLGLVDGRAVLVCAVALAALWRFRRVAIGVAVALLLVITQPAAVAARDVELARGAHLWRADAAVLVLDGGTDVGRVIDALRRRGVRRLDLVVARRGTRTVADVVFDLRSRLGVGAVLAPSDHRIRDASAVSSPATVRIGRLTVRLAPDGDALDVDIGETADRGGGTR